jgi:hypothetical protein
MKTPTTQALHTAALTGLLSLALLSPATAADFTGNLKGVTITDAQATNKPPTAAFTYTVSGQTVTFDASGSSDSDGTIAEYKWDFGDGNTGTGITVSHQYNTLSSFPVTLTVDDEKNAISILQLNIALLPPMWIGETVGKNTWTLIYVDSEETVSENGAATNAFDNNPNTIWHTEWSQSNPIPPHDIQIDLKNNYSIDKFRYLPRQSGSSNGTACDYELYVSSEKEKWGTPVITGKFDNTLAQKEASFTSKNGRYVKFRVTRECNNNPWTSVAEIDFHKEG